MGITNLDVLRGWFDRGVERKARYMIVVCDTFNYEDYPVYCAADEYQERVKSSTTNMQSVMEVYDLEMDREQQLIPGHRVFNGPKGGEASD